MCDRQIANIDISKEYDEKPGTDDVHYQSFARMAAFFGRHMLPHYQQYFQMHFLNSGQIELQLDDHRYGGSAPVCPDAAVSTSCVYYGVYADGHVLTVREDLDRSCWKFFIRA